MILPHLPSAPVPPRTDTPCVYLAWGFDGRVSEYDPLGLDEAHARAKVGGLSRQEATTILGFFHRDATAPTDVGAPRLTLRVDGKWLDVGKGGIANRAGQRGRFDVVGFARFVRASPDRAKRLVNTPLVTIRVENRTREGVGIRANDRSDWTLVPPGGTRTLTSWFVEHRLRVGGKEAGVVRADLRTIRDGRASIVPTGRDAFYLVLHP